MGAEDPGAVLCCSPLLPTLLAIGLVLVTMTATAYLFHSLAGLPLAAGFVFGAIISPPDAVAALSVTQHLRVPRKIVVTLEGESLANDATSFISFRFAVAAVMTGSFSLGEASTQFGWLGTNVNGTVTGDLALTTDTPLLDDTDQATDFSGGGPIAIPFSAALNQTNMFTNSLLGH